MSDIFINIPSDTGGGGGGGTITGINGQPGPNITIAAGSGITVTSVANTITISSTLAGGTVTNVSVVSANGFSGTVSNPTTTPAITVSTSITGLLKGNGTAISAASAGTDYVIPSGSITGTASNITATSNSTLTTLSALTSASSLALSGSQISGGTFGVINGSNLTNLPAGSLSGIIPIANGGTNNSSAYTAGSVIFSNGTSLTQDNSKFFWDDTNFTLGLNTIPGTTTSLDIVNANGIAKPIQSTAYGVGSSVPFRGRFARGTVLSPSAVQSGDNLSVYSGRGYGTSQFAAASTGVITITAGETFTNTSNATYLAFSTTPTGSVTATERMRINSTGNVLIDTVTDNGVDSLQVGSGIYTGYTKFYGSISGTVNVTAPSTVTSYTLTLPSSQGAIGTFLQNDGSGNLSFATAIANNNIDGGTAASLYTAAQVIVGGTP